MLHIGRGLSSTPDNPLLAFYGMTKKGLLADVYSLSYQIFYTPSESTAVQVFPSTPGVKQSVAVSGSDKLATGYYVATGWTVPMDAALGHYIIRWFVKDTATSAEVVKQQQFEVISLPLALPSGYGSVQDFRDQGITTAKASDAKILNAIQIATQFIDNACKQFFEPRQLSISLDGSGSNALFLDMPIIAISQVIENEDVLELSDGIVVYNRHITQGLLAPDDRGCPQITFGNTSCWGIRPRFPYPKHRRVWARGKQNIYIDGIFGYTDYDPYSPLGSTPALIRTVCAMIGLIYTFPKGSSEWGRYNHGQIIEERTLDQNVKFGRSRLDNLGSRGGATPWTDDPEINMILDMYRAPPAIATTNG